MPGNSPQKPQDGLVPFDEQSSSGTHTMQRTASGADLASKTVDEDVSSLIRLHPTIKATGEYRYVPYAHIDIYVKQGWQAVDVLPGHHSHYSILMWRSLDD